MKIPCDRRSCPSAPKAGPASLFSKASQLASLAAVSASAIALTGGTAEADTIIASGILNTPIGFTSDSNPVGSTFASHVFHTFASGPDFRVVAVGGSNDGIIFSRRVAAYSGIHTSRFGSIAGAIRVPLNASWNSVTVQTSAARFGARLWGRETNTGGKPPVTDAYSLFRFSENSVTEYGWLEFSLSVTDADSPSHLDGPNVTIVQYAFDNTGATIAAGELGMSPSPEPASIAESGFAALLLGAESWRRWRKAKKTA